MDATTVAQPLASRSTNTHLGPVNVNTSEKPATSTTTDRPEHSADSDAAMLEHHRKMLQEKLANGHKSQSTYVSPSDDIMSPCTKKLSDLKGKRFKNVGKPQSLFTKLSKKSYEQAGGGQEQ